MTFETKQQIVDQLIQDWGCKKESFYNTPTNKTVNSFWTFNRTLQYLYKLERNYVKTEHGVMLKEFYENVYIKE
jgi:hypothetical protein